MIAETVSLGILSLPSTLKAVGLVPSVNFAHSCDDALSNVY
jgi:hypothetical protein